MKRARAFTLVEMMLVVVILSVLAAAVVSNLGGVYADISLESAAGDIQAAARRGAEIARSERAPSVLVFEMEEGSYRLESGRKEQHGSETRIEWDGFLPSGVSFVRLDLKESASSNRLRFQPDGRCDEGVLVIRGRRGLEKEVRFASVPGGPVP